MTELKPGDILISRNHTRFLFIKSPGFFLGLLNLRTLQTEFVAVDQAELLHQFETTEGVKEIIPFG